jgi:hypothetical protein
MGNKRPRTPHFITGIGDGNVHDRTRANGGDDTHNLDGGGGNGINNGSGNRSNNNQKIYDARNYNLRAPSLMSRNERLQRLEEPLFANDHWTDGFGTNTGPDGIGKTGASTIASGPWQVSAFAFLGMIVVVSAIFLHFVSESTAEHGTPSSSSSPYHYRRRQRQRRMHKIRKKKTDEWSDDEEPIQNGAGLVPSDKSSSGGGGTSPDQAKKVQRQTQVGYPYFYQQPPSHTRFVAQDSRLRRTGTKEPYSPQNPPSGHQFPRKNSSGSHSNHYSMPPTAQQQQQANGGTVPTYASPGIPGHLLNLTPRIPTRGLSPKDSFSSGGGSQYGASSPPSFPRYPSAPLSARLRVPSTPDAHEVFCIDPSLSNRGSKFMGTTTSLLPAPPEESPLLIPKPPPGANNSTSLLQARPLNASNVSSFASMADDFSHLSENENLDTSSRIRKESHHSDSSHGLADLLLGDPSARSQSSHNSNRYVIDHGMCSSHHQQSLLLSPGNYEETPVIGNVRRVVHTPKFKGTPTLGDGLMPPIGTDDEMGDESYIPYIPSLVLRPKQTGWSSDGATPRLTADPPPRSILLDELRIVQMEKGNSTQWEVEGGKQDAPPQSEQYRIGYESQHAPVFEMEKELNYLSEESSHGDSDISIPSGDPRKVINHKRRLSITGQDWGISTDSATSLQKNVNFNELDLQEVIGGGGFGQVWRATWRGTPVAVKVLTGSAQNKHVARVILEEFKAEINLLKGMSHPNICLYMGACVDPPNRAIITELAVHGSVWDALRLPLAAPYVVADGTPNGCWPLRLYMPGHYGAPPGSQGANLRVSAPIPPRGTWPWDLVRRVSCGAARGMAYLHSGDPPVLHRDLKSANLLLDEGYKTKVCDFGLSRLKAQARSMTGNCGTVQWMAPEVLANRSYDEKADVYSFGIILWELLTRECPYEGMAPIACALAVLNRDKRPEIPKWCPPGLHALIKACVKKEPSERPSFPQIILALDAME